MAAVVATGQIEKIRPTFLAPDDPCSVKRLLEVFDLGPDDSEPGGEQGELIGGNIAADRHLVFELIHPANHLVELLDEFRLDRVYQVFEEADVVVDRLSDRASCRFGEATQKTHPPILA